MSASATPMMVKVSLPDRGIERKVTPGGGEISIATPQSHRLMLRVPADGLVRNARITARPVTALEPSPFAGGEFAAVAIDGGGASLRRGATIVVELRGRAAAAAGEVAGFAIDPGGELHLHPARVLAGPSSTRQIELPIGRFGIYGAAIAEPAEVEALHQRQPSDLTSRLEADLAMALRPRSEAKAAGMRPAVVLAALQSSTAFPPFVPPLIGTMITRLREWDDFRMRNLMTGIQPACRQRDLPLFELLQEDMARWENMVYQVVQATGESDPAGPGTRDDEEAYWTKLRAEFDERIKTRHFVFWTKLRILFDSLHACCLKTGQDWIPTALNNTARIAVLQDQADDVLGKDYADRIDMCKCTVASAKGTAAWRGRITHVETWRPQQAVVARGGRTTTNSAEQDYRAQLELAEERGGGNTLAFQRATGSRKEVMDDVWPPCSATHHTEQYLTGRYADEEIVHIRTWPDGRYEVTYVPPPAEGTVTGRVKSTLVGNCTPDALENSNYEKPLPPKRLAVNARWTRGVEGRVSDPGQPRFQGTFDTEVPYTAAGVSGPVKVHVEWDLTRCGRR